MKKHFYSLFIFLFPSSMMIAQQWSDMDTGINGPGTKMFFYNNQLIIAGSYSTAGNVSALNIASWDGGAWHALGAGVTGFVYAMTEYHGQLYVAGSFGSAGNIQTRRIARWNGVSWDSVGHGINNGNVFALEVYNDKLYVGGQFTSAGYVPAKNMAVWNDTAWSAVGAGITTTLGSSQVEALKVYQGELYAGGHFGIAGTDSACSEIARWNGTSWSHAGEGFDQYSDVNALAVFQNRLIMAGAIWRTMNSYVYVNNIAQWDGNSYSAVGTGTDFSINSIHAYGNNLYIGGFFTTAGNNPAAHIALWDGGGFYPLGLGVDTTVYDITADEGIVCAAGSFTTAGGNPVGHVAKWSFPGMAIHNVQSDEMFSVYPNPSTGIFNFHSEINSGDEVIEIYNPLGEKIRSFAVKNEDEQIDLSGEAEGVYFCRVFDEGKTITIGKLVLQ